MAELAVQRRITRAIDKLELALADLRAAAADAADAARKLKDADRFLQLGRHEIRGAQKELGRG